MKKEHHSFIIFEPFSLYYYIYFVDQRAKSFPQRLCTVSLQEIAKLIILCQIFGLSLITFWF